MIEPTKASLHLQHLLSIDALSQRQLTTILDTAEFFLPKQGNKIAPKPLLTGKMVFNLFFENSTRTRTTFELAAKKLGADVVNLNVAHSSKSKGETDLDTFLTLQAMGADVFVIRHPKDGAVAELATSAAVDVGVINAGDGCHAHPTQGLLDVLTIRRRKHNFADLRVAIVGDVRHSRVANSTISALKILGTQDIRIAGPAHFLPTDSQSAGVQLFEDMPAAVKNADVVIGLRVQKERIQGQALADKNIYHQRFGLTANNLQHAQPDALIMHPGPINRGVEITPDIAYGQQSAILEQVRNGIAIRMAVMALIAGPN